MTICSPLRAITLRQPWPYSVFHLDKDTENRSWWWDRLAGQDLAIHSSSSYDPAGEQWIRDQLGLPVPEITRRFASLILGVVTVKGAHLSTECARPGGTFSCSRWAMGRPDGRRVYHWELADVRPCREPVPCTGARMIWTVKPATAERVLARI